MPLFGFRPPPRAGATPDGRVVARRWAFLVLGTLCVTGTVGSLRADPSTQGEMGLPYTRFYSFDEIGKVSRGARLGFDPLGRIVVARGRDATDVPLLHSFGAHRLTMFKVWTYEQAAECEPMQPQRVNRTMNARMLA